MKQNLFHTSLPSGKIIIIDDNELFRASLEDAVKDLGYTVIAAENGLDGVQAVELHPDADLVFVDLIMPVMDGYSFIETIRDTHPDLPIVVVSGLGTIDDALPAIRLGAWDFLGKPIQNIEILKLTIMRNIERHMALKANRAYNTFLENLSKMRSSQLEVALEKKTDCVEEGLAVYHSAFLASPSPSLILDKESGTIIEANQKLLDLVGWQSQDVKGMGIDRLLPGAQTTTAGETVRPADELSLNVSFSNSISILSMIPFKAKERQFLLVLFHQQS